MLIFIKNKLSFVNSLYIENVLFDVVTCHYIVVWFILLSRTIAHTFIQFIFKFCVNLKPISHKNMRMGTHHIRKCSSFKIHQTIAQFVLLKTYISRAFLNMWWSAAAVAQQSFNTFQMVILKKIVHKKKAHVVVVIKFVINRTRACIYALKHTHPAKRRMQLNAQHALIKCQSTDKLYLMNTTRERSFIFFQCSMCLNILCT